MNPTYFFRNNTRMFGSYNIYRLEKLLFYKPTPIFIGALTYFECFFFKYYSKKILIKDPSIIEFPMKRHKFKVHVIKLTLINIIKRRLQYNI
jgi:hypothetical protein